MGMGLQILTLKEHKEAENQKRTQVEESADVPGEICPQKWNLRGVCLGERRTESGRGTPNVLTLEKAEEGVLGDGCLI